MMEKKKYFFDFLEGGPKMKKNSLHISPPRWKIPSFFSIFLMTPSLRTLHSLGSDWLEWLSVYDSEEDQKSR